MQLMKHARIAAGLPKKQQLRLNAGSHRSPFLFTLPKVRGYGIIKEQKDCRYSRVDQKN